MNALWKSLLLTAILMVSTPILYGDILQAKGKLAMLRVHDVGSGYGPQSDYLDVEVVIRLDTAPDKAFGFTLRNDANALAHEGMLSILRSAFEQGWTVTIDYSVSPPKKNGVILRAIVTK